MVVVILLWILSEAYRDAETINKKHYITSHTSRTVNRITVGLLGLCVNFYSASLVLLLFWGLFDTALNVFRKLPWNYIGSEANSDQFALKNQKLYWFSKLIAIIGSVLIIIKIYFL